MSKIKITEIEKTDGMATKKLRKHKKGTEDSKGREGKQEGEDDGRKNAQKAEERTMGGLAHGAVHKS